MRVLAFEQAAVLYGRALDALALTPPGDERRRYDLLCALGSAKQRSGDLHLACEAWRRAASAARAMGSADLLADAAIGYAAAVGSSADESRRNLLEEARAALPPVDGHAQALVHVMLGRELADRGLAIARRLGDAGTLRHVLAEWHLAARTSPELLGERLQVAQEMLDAAAEAGDPERAVLARQWLAADLLAAGDVAGAAVHLDAGGREAGELGTSFLRWGITTQQANLSLLQGRPEEADRLSRAALAIGERNRLPDADDVYREQRRALWVETGRIEEVEVETRSNLAQPSTPGWKADCLRIDLALITAQRGRHDEARCARPGRRAGRGAGLLPGRTSRAVLAARRPDASGGPLRPVPRVRRSPRDVWHRRHVARPRGSLSRSAGRADGPIRRCRRPLRCRRRPVPADGCAVLAGPHRRRSCPHASDEGRSRRQGAGRRVGRCRAPGV